MVTIKQNAVIFDHSSIVIKFLTKKHKEILIFKLLSISLSFSSL